MRRILNKGNTMKDTTKTKKDTTKTKKDTTKTKKDKKTERENVSSKDYSETTTAIISAAKKIGATAEQTSPSVLRVRVNGTTILRLAGLSSENPSMFLKIARITGSDEDPWKDFQTVTGLSRKNFKKSLSEYQHTADSDTAKRARIFFSHLRKDKSRLALLS